jgi:hypothetical protein
MSKVKNMIALQALIEEKRRTGFASDIAAANEADAVLDPIHQEIIRLEAIEADGWKLVDLWRKEGERRHDAQGPAYTLLSTLAGCAGALAAILDRKP